MSGRFTPGARRPRMVRSRAARAHPSLHGEAAARRRSSPSRRRTSCASCCAGSTSRPPSGGRGPDALDAVIAQLQGFEAPAAAWEAEILPARLDEYDFTWLDDLCLSGRAVWTRLTPPGATTTSRGGGPIRTTPIALLPRRAAPLWNRAGTTPRASRVTPSVARAARRRLHLREHGASFFDEIVDGTRLLRTQVEEALGELVALGPRHLRQLRRPARAADAVREAQALRRRRGHRRALFGIEDAGRWSLRKRASRRAAARRRRDAMRRAHRACAAAAPLWRRVLADAATRGRVAAAVAGAAARAAPPRGARRHPRRPLRRKRQRRAVRAARGGRGAARNAPRAR